MQKTEQHFPSDSAQIQKQYVFFFESNPRILPMRKKPTCFKTSFLTDLGKSYIMSDFPTNRHRFGQTFWWRRKHPGLIYLLTQKTMKKKFELYI